MQGWCVLLMHTHWSLSLWSTRQHVSALRGVQGGRGWEGGAAEGQRLFYFYWPVAGGHGFHSLPSALPPHSAVCGEAQASLAPRGLN